MGRFYKTAQPDFIDNFIYQPPWQLMNQVMATKQQDYNNAMQSTDLIRNMLDIKHLSFEDNRAKELKEYYNGKIDELTTQLAKNPNEYNKVMPVIKNLARELDTDRKEGNISKIEGRYNWLQQKQKDNAEVLKADPEAYNRMLNYEYSDLVKRATNDITASGGSEKYVSKPDMNSKELRDLFEKFKADKWEQMSKDGRWITSTKEAKEQEIQDAFWNEYSSNPLVKEYTRQGTLTKAAGFYDENTGKPIDLFQFVDNTGKIISRDEAIKLQENWDRKSPFPFSKQLNSNHGFAGGIKGYGDIFGFKEIENRETKYGLNTQKHQYKIDEINKQGNINYKNAYKLAAAKGDIKLAEDIMIAVSPQQIVTKEEQAKIGERYNNLFVKSGGGKDLDKLTAQEQIDFNRYNTLYGNLSNQLHDIVLETKGYSKSQIEDIKKREAIDPAFKKQIESENTQTIMNLQKLDKTPGFLGSLGFPTEQAKDAWGYELTPGVSGGIGSTGVPISSQVKTEERLLAEKLKQNIQDKTGDVDKTISEGLVVTRGYLPTNNNSVLGKVGNSFINTLYSIGGEPLIYDINTTLRDMDGKVRDPNKRIDVDTSMWSSGKTSNPMSVILSKTGSKNLEDLQAKGFGTITYVPDGKKIRIDFRPNNAALEKIGIDTGDKNWSPEGFSMVYNNVDHNLKAKLSSMMPKEYNPTLQQIINSADETYSTINQKVNLSVGQLKTIGNSIPFYIPQTGEKRQYRISNNKGGGYILESKATNETWDKAVKGYANTEEEIITYLSNQ